MKKFIILLMLFAASFSMMTSCQKKQTSVETQPVMEEPVVNTPQVVHIYDTIKLKDLNHYTYFNAPNDEAVTDVCVKYDTKHPYAAPIIVKYTYQNGDTYTYIIPEEFGLRKNEYGRFRIIQDGFHTVWMQGQNNKGYLYEIVFYGDPQFNLSKIKPNSYFKHPYGSIRYCN